MAKKELAPVVAVLNMKGGVGKTTISANVFRRLYSGYKISTLLIDLDPQYNLTQTLFKRSAYEVLLKDNKTIFAAMEPPSQKGLLDVATSTSPPPAPDAISKRLLHSRITEHELVIVPGDFRLVKYSLMSENRKLALVRDRFLKFIRSAREQFQVVCIDCNPSSSFITLCALHACTHLLVPVRPDRYSILGLELLADFVDSVPTILPKPPISIVLNGVPRCNYNRAVENELRAHPVFGTSTFVSVIRHSEILVARHDYTGFATDKPVPHRTKVQDDMSAIADELAQRLGIER